MIMDGINIKKKTGGKWECVLDINLKIKPTEYSLVTCTVQYNYTLQRLEGKVAKKFNQEVVAQTKGIKNYCKL